MEKFDVPFLAYESSIKGRVQMQEGKLRISVKSDTDFGTLPDTRFGLIPDG